MIIFEGTFSWTKIGGIGISGRFNYLKWNHAIWFYLTDIKGPEEGFYLQKTTENAYS